MLPLTPDVPALAVDRSMAPLLVAVPAPVDIFTAPPVPDGEAAEEEPAVMVTPPPWPVLPEPTDSVIAPPLPPVPDPVLRKMEPPLPAVEFPVYI
jgi:hypothetical protein